MIENGPTLPKLPQGWVWLKLVDACQYLPTGVDEYNESIEYYSTGSITEGSYVPEGLYSFSERPSRANRMSKTGDVFQARMANTNKAILIKGDLARKLFSTGFIQLRPFDFCADMSPYIYYYVQSTDFLKQRDALATGSTQVALTDGSAVHISFPLPPLPEQHRIVAKIEELLPKLDAGVEALTGAKLQLRRYRQSILKSAFEGKLTADWREAHKSELEPAFKLVEKIKNERQKKSQGKAKELPLLDASELPNLPDGWVWVSLEQLSWDSSYGTSEKCDYDYTGPPVIRIPNIIKGRIDLGDLKYASANNLISGVKPLASGDLLLIRTNGSKNLIGRAALVSQDFDRHYYFASYLIRFRLLNINCLPAWVNALFKSYRIRLWMEREAATSAGQYNISLVKFNRLPLPIPPLSEQNRILEEIDRCFSVVDEMEKTIEQSLNQAERLRHSILKKAFEGKLVPQDPNDEPAERLLGWIKTEKARQQASVMTPGSRNRRNTS